MEYFWFGVIAAIPLFLFIGMLVGYYLKIPTRGKK